MLSLSISFSLQIFWLYITVSDFVFMDCLCVNMCVPVSACISCVFSLTLLILFILSYLSLLLLLLLLIPTCIPIKEKKKGCWGLGDWGSRKDLGGIWEGATIIRIYDTKNSLSSIKKENTM